MEWLNIFGLILVVLILVPNIIYAFKFRDQQNKCTNKIMNIIEQVGRYGCMFLMIFNLGIAEFGFASKAMFLVYLIGNAAFLLSYLIIWILYFKKQTFWKQLSLTIIPTCLFLLSGITMQHYLLVIWSVIFGIGHIFVTNKNRVE